MDETQATLCERFGAEFQPGPQHLKVGVALATLQQRPINGLRHTPQGDTTGWYIWGGPELSSGDDFFQPVHVSHLNEILPSIAPYLGLPAGWRFQVAPGHEDVWFDVSLFEES